METLRCRRAAVLGLLLVLAGASLPGSSPRAQPELNLVRDMLRLDAERAINAERAKSGRPAVNAAVTPVKRPDRIAVAAIYGLAGALQADVLVNGERLHFRQGQAQARNATTGTGAATGSFQLAKIDDLCVHLTRSGERTPRVVCYAAAAPAWGAVAGYGAATGYGQASGHGLASAQGSALTGGPGFPGSPGRPLAVPFGALTLPPQGASPGVPSHPAVGQ